MQSILQEIMRIRADGELHIDYHNANRYRVVLQEQNHTRTAYYFSSPIYNIHTKEAVDVKFHSRGGMYHLKGSNADITINDQIHLKNQIASCDISLRTPVTSTAKEVLYCNRDTIYPTTNGVAYRAYIKNTNEYSFIVRTENHFSEIRANDKTIAFMQEQFRPLFSISCIGTCNEYGNVIAPAKIRCQKEDEKTYIVTLIPRSPIGTYVLFEVNLYEPKLFQDTTVESGRPKVNNAFGNTAFLGTTVACGEQWLYTRLDFSKMTELLDKRIHSAILYMPQYNSTQRTLAAYGVTARFCSFGSNWDNKVKETYEMTNSYQIDGYQVLNITNHMTEPYEKRIRYNNGFILRTKDKTDGFVAVATADNYYTPQILEINYE